MRPYPPTSSAARARHPRAASFATRAAIAVGLFAAAASVACAGENADDTVVEPSLDQRIDGLAEAACDRYADTSSGCPGYGTADDQKFETESACRNDFKAKASDLWPASECADRRVDDGRYEKCVERVKAFACSQGGQNLLDGFAALSECDADEVCTDAPR